MIELSIPDPSLVVLMGAAGAGKSTFAARHFDPSEVLSADAYRARISGDPANQAVTRAAFGMLHRDLGRRLQAQQLSVVDATNLGRAARRVLLRLAAAGGVPAVAVVFDLPSDVILARNAARTTRIVDEAVVRRHLALIRTMIDGPATDLHADGFSLVTTVRDPEELDGLIVVRRRSGVTPEERVGRRAPRARSEAHQPT